MDPALSCLGTSTALWFLDGITARPADSRRGARDRYVVTCVNQPDSSLNIRAIGSTATSYVQRTRILQCMPTSTQWSRRFGVPLPMRAFTIDEEFFRSITVAGVREGAADQRSL